MIKEYWKCTIGPLPTSVFNGLDVSKLKEAVNNTFQKTFQQNPEYFNSKIIFSGGKQYWKCIIGPTYRKDLPNGADSPLRIAVEDEFYFASDGCSPEDCYSGWGHDIDGNSIGWETLYNEKQKVK